MTRETVIAMMAWYGLWSHLSRSLLDLNQMTFVDLRPLFVGSRSFLCVRTRPGSSRSGRWRAGGGINTVAYCKNSRPSLRKN
jgi:hypothetical protein